jgi:hypothetical protein
VTTGDNYAASALFWVLTLAGLGWGSGLVITAVANHLTRRGGRK